MKRISLFPPFALLLLSILFLCPSSLSAWPALVGGDTIHGRITSAVDTVLGLSGLEVGAVMGSDTTRTLTDGQGYYNLVTPVGVSGEVPATGRQGFWCRVAPNPGSRSVIWFSLPFEAVVELDIFNVAGQRVKTLSSHARAGVNGFLWDGRDGANQRVSDGVYIYRLRAGKQSVSGSLVLVKNGKSGRLDALVSGGFSSGDFSQRVESPKSGLFNTMYQFYVRDPARQWSLYKDDSLIVSNGNKLENDRMIPNRRLDFNFMNGSDSVNTEVGFFNYMWRTDLSPYQLFLPGYYPFKVFADTIAAPSSWRRFPTQSINDWNNAVGSNILNEVTDTTGWGTLPYTRIRFRYVDNDTTYPIYGADGYCELFRIDSFNRPTDYRVWINTGHAQTDSNKVRVCRHEEGHTIITWEHSLNRAHIMYVARGAPYNITLDESILAKIQMGVFPLKKVRNYWNP